MQPDAAASQSGGKNSTNDENAKREESREAIRIIAEMSRILNVGLDPEALGLCIRLCEAGANPNHLANLMKGWRQERSNGN